MDHTITELQAQIDQLSLALHQWRSTQDHLEPTEQRLTELTDRCADILNRWAATDQRHAQAVGQVEERLGEWNAIEARLQRDAIQRLRELETVIENEWKALKQMHEEPIRQLREQATALGETCMSAANLALKSFEKAETRIAALETDLTGRLTKLSDDVAAIALRSEGPRQGALPPSGAAPFPLEGVMRIHDELRGTATPAPTALEPRPVASAEPTAALAHRIESLEREMTTEREEVREAATRTARMRWQWRVLLLGLIAAVIGGSVYGVVLQRRVNAQLDAAAVRAAAAERDAAAATAAATRQIEATRAEADRRIAAAQQAALQAQVMSSVLAAPDLVRLPLAGPPDTPFAAASAQVLWSRSRGLILNASRLPDLPAGMTYQIWMLGEGAGVNAGFLSMEGGGRGSIVAPNPADLPRRVTGVIVTLEPEGGASTSSTSIVLARPQITPQ